MENWQDKAEFKARVMEWANKLDITVNAISLRQMKNKWASCSTNGNLTFDSALLDMRKEIGDYVIVHELLHFKVPNHGRLWKSLMQAHLGNYELVEMELGEFLKSYKPSLEMVSKKRVSKLTSRE